MSENSQDKKIEELLSRGVDEIIDTKHLKERLESSDKLRVKFGIDPTSPHIHIGRSVPLLKLRDFQELGHTVCFVIGDFTGVIGDTSDKDAERPMLSSDDVAKNMRDYVEQAGKILDVDKCEIHHNSKWLSKLSYKEISEQADIFSVNQFISRDNIRKRLDEGKRISLREVLYPLMQGYDSVEIKADVEVGGTDQRFNLLAGRALQERHGQQAQDIIMNPLIVGTDGRKMSSSWGNTINITDEARDMYGKVMTISDELIIPYFTFVTRMSLDEILKHESELSAGTNPKDIKMKLAYELTRMYHDEPAAKDAQEYFTSTFSEKQIPSDVRAFTPKEKDIISVLIDAKLVESKSEARRIIEQSGVKVNEEVIADNTYIVSDGDIVQKGKRDFIKIVF